MSAVTAIPAVATAVIFTSAAAAIDADFAVATDVARMISLCRRERDGSSIRRSGSFFLLRRPIAGASATFGLVTIGMVVAAPQQHKAAFARLAALGFSCKSNRFFSAYLVMQLLVHSFFFDPTPHNQSLFCSTVGLQFDRHTTPIIRINNATVLNSAVRKFDESFIQIVLLGLSSGMLFSLLCCRHGRMPVLKNPLLGCHGSFATDRVCELCSIHFFCSSFEFLFKWRTVLIQHRPTL
jgi:hypothetical protein